MDFEMAKKLLKESIDEGKTVCEILEIFTDKVYQKGKEDWDRKENENEETVCSAYAGSGHAASRSRPG